MSWSSGLTIFPPLLPRCSLGLQCMGHIGAVSAGAGCLHTSYTKQTNDVVPRRCVAFTQETALLRPIKRVMTMASLPAPGGAISGTLQPLCPPQLRGTIEEEGQRDDNWWDKAQGKLHKAGTLIKFSFCFRFICLYICLCAMEVRTQALGASSFLSPWRS